MKQSLLDYVKHQLGATKGKWKRVSEETGVPYFTITNIVQGRTPNPGVLTVQRLADYFDRQASLS